MKILEILRGAFAKIKAAITASNEVIKKHGQDVRTFVIETVNELEILIPDHGYGNIKILMFDASLKVFVDAMKADGAEPRDLQNIWDLAHVMVEGHVAALKATEGWK